MAQLIGNCLNVGASKVMYVDKIEPHPISTLYTLGIAQCQVLGIHHQNGFFLAHILGRNQAQDYNVPLQLILNQIDGTDIPRNQWAYFWCANGRQGIHAQAFATALEANGIQIPENNFVDSTRVRLTWTQNQGAQFVALNLEDNFPTMEFTITDLANQTQIIN